MISILCTVCTLLILFSIIHIITDWKGIVRRFEDRVNRNLNEFEEKHALGCGCLEGIFEIISALFDIIF